MMLYLILFGAHQFLLAIRGKQEPPFRHAGRFAEAGRAIEQGLTAYAAAVRDGSFPTAANAVSIDAETVAAAIALAERG